MGASPIQFSQEHRADQKPALQRQENSVVSLPECLFRRQMWPVVRGVDVVSRRVQTSDAEIENKIGVVSLQINTGDKAAINFTSRALMRRAEEADYFHSNFLCIQQLNDQGNAMKRHHT